MIVSIIAMQTNIDIVDKLINILNGSITFFGRLIKLKKNFFHPVRNKKIENIIPQLERFILLPRVKWGKTIESTVKYYTTTAEGLIAMCCIYELTKDKEIGFFGNIEEEIVTSQIHECIGDMTEYGFLSKSTNKYGILCTSMMLFAIKRCIDVGINLQLDESEQAKINRCLDILNETCIPHMGWMYENKFVNDPDNPNNERYFRSFSTIWAIRALNIWGHFDASKYESIIKSLANECYASTNCTNNANNSVAIASMFLILLNEFKEIKTHQKYKIILKANKAIDLLLKNPNKSVNVEQFYFETNNSITHDSMRTWYHMCDCLIIEATSLYKSKMKLKHKLVYKKLLSNTFFQIVNYRDAKYYCPNSLPNNNIEDPYIYPTCSLIFAYHSYLVNYK